MNVNNSKTTISNGNNPPRTESESQQQPGTGSEPQPPRWYQRYGDAINLFIGTIVLSLLGYWITVAHFNIEQRNNRHIILKEYIDGISSLTFDKDLKENEEETKSRSAQVEKTFGDALESGEKITIQNRFHLLQSIKNKKDLSNTVENAKTMAIGQTRTALRRLEDGDFKGYLIRFLHESELIKSKRKLIQIQGKLARIPDKLELTERKAVITLSGADINDVKLIDAPLEDIQLEGAYMKKADFSNAGLQRANLQGAHLDGTNLQNADLQKADLSKVILIPTKGEIEIPEILFLKITLPSPIPKEAKLNGANLQGANFQDADLQGANLQNANLKEADFRGVKNLTPEQVRSAKNWEKACYDLEFNNELDLPIQEQGRNCKDKESL